MKRPVAYIRQSLVDKASSSPERQRETTDSFAARREWVIIEYYIDIGGRRSDVDDSEHRPNFLRMMADARLKKFDTILVSSQERFGTPDIYSFYGLMGELRNLGIEVWDCTAGIIINPPGHQLGTVFQAFAGTVIDTGEQQARAKNVCSGQVVKSKQGRYLGGGIAYGTCIKCISDTGKTMWTCEVIGARLYETTYSDGRVVIRNYTPTGDKADTDKILFDRSKYTDRILAVQRCFELFLAGFGCSTIVGDLKSHGWTLPGGKPFYSSVIQGFIRTGIIYTGRSGHFKVSRGKFYNYKSGLPTAVDNLRGKAARIKNNIDDWTTSEVMFEPIIAPEVFRAAYDLLAGKSRPRTRQNQSALYAGILYCENCGTRMTADGDRYRCTTYLNKGGPKSSCTPNFIRASVIDERVASWLDDTGKTLNWTGDKAPVKALYQIGEINQRLLRLKPLIEAYLADQLAQVFEFTVNRDGSKNFSVNGHRFTLPGYQGCPQELHDLLGTVEASVNSSIDGQMAKMVARKDHLLAIFSDADNQDLRISIVKELNALDSQLKHGGKTDYDSQYRSLIKQLHRVYLTSKRAKVLVDNTSRSLALRSVIDKISCKFKQVRRGKTIVNLIDTITISPKIDEMGPGRMDGTGPGVEPGRPGSWPGSSSAGCSGCSPGSSPWRIRRSLRRGLRDEGQATPGA